MYSTLNKLARIVQIMAYLLYASHSVGAEDLAERSKFTKDNVETIADCSGLFWALSLIYKGGGQKNISETFRNFGNGYYLAAAYGFRITKGYSNQIAHKEAKSKESVSKSYYLALYEDNPEHFLEQDAVKYILICKNLNEQQMLLKELAMEEVRQHQSTN